jgi:hypothetical protein
MIRGDGSRADVLGMGIFAEQKASNYFLNEASPAAHGELANSRQLATMWGNRSVATKEKEENDPAFVERMLSHSRFEHAAPLRALPAGVTDVRTFRLWVANGLNNVTLE